MADINELIKLLDELDDQLVNCMRCGLCQSVCPVFAETMREGDVTRGKIALLDGLSSRMIKDAKGVKERLDKCLMCGTCQANCPSGVNAMDIFIRARAILTGYLGLSPVKKAIFRGGLANPGLFGRLLEMAGKLQFLGISSTASMLGTSCSKMMSPLIGDRHFVPLAPTSLHRRTGAKDEKRGRAGIRIAFFPGCVTERIYPSIGEALMKVMAYHDVSVYMPENQGCCGIPALSSGDTETFQKLLSHNMKLFGSGDFDYLVTPCATCTATIKELWPKMAEKQKGAVARLTPKVMDISEFLVDRLGVKGLVETAKGGKKVTYHDPCHLDKSLGITNQPRTLLSLSPEYEFVEMAEANRCCGNGGSFNLQHYELSKKIGERKRKNVTATGASVVATSCPACMMQLTDQLSRKNDQVEVKHVIEIYAESLR